MRYKTPPTGLLSLADNIDMLMGLEEIVQRWEPARKAGVPPREAVLRMAHRAKAIREFLGLPSRPRPRNARKWETAWNRNQFFGELSAAAARLGWAVRTVERFEADPVLLSSAGGEDNVFLVEQAAAGVLLDRLRAAGLRLPFQQADALLIQLAEGLFQLGADHAGQDVPEEWIEEAAPSVFAQDVLGLPFCPLVLRVLEKK